MNLALGAQMEQNLRDEYYPNCAKRLECVELAPAFHMATTIQEREQAPRTPNASRGSTSPSP